MKRLLVLCISLFMFFILSSCKDNNENKKSKEVNDGVYYQIFVRSFADSNGDGIGDLNGITENLDYLEDLGISGIWLMPIFPTDSYHGYDVKDYYSINPEYGTLDDFNRLIKEANKRNIKVILDLVLNHTSNKHEWFIDASKNPNSEYRDYYYWINKDDYRVKKTAPGGVQLWHALGDEYFASSFPGDYADLNFLNDKVKDEAFNITKFWLDKGVKGFRLDAAMYLFLENKVPTKYTYRDGIIFWYRFRKRLQEIYPQVYLVGEVWSNVNTYSQYYTGLDSTFNFDLSNLIIDVANRGNGYYVNQLNQIYNSIEEKGEIHRDSPFLRNHDMDRTSSVLQGDLSKMKLAAEMLLTLPGNPYIYYGEEIGMFGRTSGGVSGVYDETRRLPFVWGNKNVETKWTNNICELDGISCEQPIKPALKQMEDENSLYNVYKSLIKLRKDHQVLYNGNFLPYNTGSIYVQGFFRYNNKQLYLVLHNVSNKERAMPQFEDAKLIYESKHADTFETGMMAERSTIIIELPYSVLKQYL